jgi:two-component system sensor kinase FixL
MTTSELPAEVAALADRLQATVVVDAVGVVVVMNSAAEELLGHRAEDVVGDFVEHLLPTDKRWTHDALRRGYLADPVERDMGPGLDPEGERPDGEAAPVYVHLVPMTLHDELYVVAEKSPRSESHGFLVS